MRKALIVGIDYYCSIDPLFGCVNDAHAVKAVLDRNSDGTVNFDTRLLSGTGPADMVNRSELRQAVHQLFDGDSDIALFYFAGHGYIETTGGFLCPSDCKNGNDGLSLADVINFASLSKAKNKIVVLDSCHSGVAGTSAHNPAVSELKEGMTILTASTAEQYASEQNGSGVFTTLFVDGLNGAAGNLVGDVTPGSVYAHIDQSLGAWDQRPLFKTNVKSFVSLRKVQAPIPLADLQRITEFFPTPGYCFKLGPEYEPERGVGDAHHPVPDPLRTHVFAILQKYNRVGLVVPNEAPHMWHAAMQSKSCKLTALGEHYRRLVELGRI